MTQLLFRKLIVHVFVFEMLCFEKEALSFSSYAQCCYSKQKNRNANLNDCMNGEKNEKNSF